MKGIDNTNYSSNVFKLSYFHKRFPLCLLQPTVEVLNVWQLCVNQNNGDEVQC